VEILQHQTGPINSQPDENLTSMRVPLTHLKVFLLIAFSPKFPPNFSAIAPTLGIDHDLSRA
jgi:hypothetical protein